MISRTFYLRLAFCVWAGIVSIDSIAYGAEWSVEPTLRSEGQFHDNLRLATGPHRNAWAMKIKPRIGLSYATETWNLTASPQYEYVRYFSRDSIEKTFNNFFLPLTGSYRTEVDRFGLEGAINRDNALISELDETGLVTSFIPRNFRNVRGSWDRLLTERLTLQSSYQFTDVSYEGTRGIRLFGYQAHAGTVGAKYQWTEETSFHSTAWYTNYHAPQNGFRSQAPGLELGISQRMFETFSVSVSGGGRYVLTTLARNGQRKKDTNLTWLFNVSLDKAWEGSRMTVGYGRTLKPSGLGVLIVTDRVNLRVDHQLTHALNVSLRGTFTDNDTVGSSSGTRGGTNSRYWQVGPAVSWRATEYWSMKLSYRHAQRKIKTSSGERARANTVILGLTYTWPTWSVSR